MTDSFAYEDGRGAALDAGGSKGAGSRFDTSISDAITTSPEEQRLRIRAIEAGYSGDERSARAMLSDPSAKVRAAALGALSILGRATDEDVKTAIEDDTPEMRRVACELATSLPQMDFARLLDDVDPRVVEACAFALGELGERDANDALIGIARDHEDPLCREAAVAALGIIGDESSKTALIAALNDVAQIRRRALIALSNFEGDDVEAATRGCLDDRDWQVRQAAADLLGINAVERR